MFSEEDSEKWSVKEEERHPHNPLVDSLMWGSYAQKINDKDEEKQRQEILEIIVVCLWQDNPSKCIEKLVQNSAILWKLLNLG